MGQNFIKTVMKQEVIMTLMGPDRPGIVADVAALVSKHDGNWLESRLLHLGGQFAGALRIEIEPEQEALLRTELEMLRQSNLSISLAEGASVDGDADRRKSLMTLSGQDQKGIVRRVFEIFQNHKVNVEELKTGIRGAPWSGHMLFEAAANLSVPKSLDVEALQAELETISNDLLVEIDWVG